MARTNYWQRLQSQRITRRRLMVGAGVGVAGLAVAEACGDGGGNGTSPTSTSVVSATATPLPTPKRGGRYQDVDTVTFDTFDPHLSVAAGPEKFPRVYNVLVTQSALKPEFIFNDLAESYEAPDPGGVEWIFTIRSGVKIGPNPHGVPERDMDAEDVRVSFERFKNLAGASAAQFVVDWWVSHVVSGNTYTVTTKAPYAWFLLNIGRNISTTPPREMIELGGDFMNQNAAGGGPFVLTSITEGEGLSFDRNPNYYRTDPNNNNAQLPYVDGFDSRLIPDRATRRTAFIDAQVYEYGAGNKAEANDLIANHDVSLTSAVPTFTFIAFTMNVTKPPWDNPLVRRAAMHALNRQEFVDIVYGGDAQVNGVVHWPTGAFALPPEELDELQKFDPELSKQLIQQAGHDLPLTIKVMFSSGVSTQEIDEHLPVFLGQMEEAGFRIEQDPQDLSTWLQNYTEKSYDASLSLNLPYETAEIPLDWQHSKGPAGSDTFSNGIMDPEIDALIEATKTLTDPDELVAAVHDAQRQIYAAGPAFLPIASPFSRTLRHNFVKNWPVGLGATETIVNDWWLDL